MVRPHSAIAPLAGTAVVLGVAVWSYWTTLAEAADRWVHDPLYSHGFLVPLFALALLAARRDGRPNSLHPNAWGVLILAGAVGLRLAGAFFHVTWLDAISLLPCLAGICVLLAGWPAFRWSWPAVAFLAFMIPLPYGVGEALAGPLRSLATPVCSFLLQATGYPALDDGNRVLLNEVNLDIVGECSGLRMLMAFFALSTAVALVTRRPLWEKLLIVASAVPIALTANVARITTTGILLESFGGRLSREAIHNVAGWAMMPLGLALLGLELLYLRYLLIEPDPAIVPIWTAAPLAPAARPPEMKAGAAGAPAAGCA
jgi:exosortase